MSKHENNITNSEASAQPLFLQLSNKERMLATIAVMLAMILASISQTSLATALPHVVSELGGFSYYTWPSTAYFLGATMVILVVGRLADLYGCRIFFLLGLTIFIISSASIVFVDTMPKLIALRAVQGIGGGTIMANSAVAIATLYSPKTRARAQGFVSSIFAISAIFGPIWAGFITDYASWHWIFFMNVLAGLPIAFFVFEVFPNEYRKPQRNKLDYAGMVLLATALIPMTLALSWGGNQYAWSSPHVLYTFAFSIVIALLFICVESKAVIPIMPFDIYKNHTVVACLTVTTLSFLGLFGGILLMPLFFQSIQGVSTTGSGGVLISLTGGLVLGANIAGQLLSRSQQHSRLLAMIGTAITTTGWFLASTMGSTTHLTQTVLYCTTAGIGIGITSSTALVTLQNVVPFERIGAVTSAMHFFRTIGGSMGLAVLGVILTTRFIFRLNNEIPHTVKSKLTPNQWDTLTNNPRMLNSFSTNGPFDDPSLELNIENTAIIEPLRSALAGAISDVFFVCASVSILAFIIVVFFMPYNKRAYQ